MTTLTVDDETPAETVQDRLLVFKARSEKAARRAVRAILENIKVTEELAHEREKLRLQACHDDEL